MYKHVDPEDGGIDTVIGRCRNVQLERNTYKLVPLQLPSQSTTYTHLHTSLTTAIITKGKFIKTHTYHNNMEPTL